MYNKSTISDNLSEEILCELLQFLQYKVRNKRLSVSDAEAIRRIFDGVEISGTADDFAQYFKQNPVNVRSVICRKYIGKPRRAVLYSFKQFLRLIPPSWVASRCAKCPHGQQDNAPDGERCNKIPQG